MEKIFFYDIKYNDSMYKKEKQQEETYGKKYKVIDLFCGCGGLSRGFELAGFNVSLAIDMWEDAIKTYNYNHKKPIGLCKDIRMLDNNFLDNYKQKHHIVGIIGGPPCQGYSTVGKRDINDDRNYLYLEYCRVVENIQPDV